MYNSVALSPLILLYSHHHHPSPEVNHLPKLISVHVKRSSISSLPLLLATTSNFCFCDMDFSRYLMFVESHSIFLFLTDLFHLACLQGLLITCICQNLLKSEECSFVCIYLIYVYPSTLVLLSHFNYWE